MPIEEELSEHDKMLFLACNKDSKLFECHRLIERKAYNKDINFDIAKQVYQWIRTGHINLRQFKHIATKWKLGLQ